MIISADILALLIALLSLLLLYLKRKPHNQRKRVNSVPEALGGWPIIGHLHLLGGQVPIHRVLAALSDRYGSIFAIRLGVHPTVVISSSEPVKECFTTNDRVLVKRPASSHGVYLGYNFAGFGFTHGPYWREVRKLVMQKMLSSSRLEMMTRVRESEVRISVAELYEAVHEDNGKVVMSQWFDQLTLNMIMRMINGKRYMRTTDDEGGVGERPFWEVAKEFMYISGQFALSDVIPFPPFRWMDFQGHIKSMKRISDELSVICERWIDEHDVEGRRVDEHDQDFIDVMLAAVDDKLTRFGHDRKTIIKATISGLILAGSDTTSVHMTWLLSLLVNNEQVMQRAKEEIYKRVGKDRWVQESDIKSLVYLQAIVKETLRLYPSGPLAVPHEALEDCIISGYHVPKGTRVMVNLWKLHRDPSMWTEPDKFMPERFLTDHVEVDFSGHHHEFIPFGSGRRSCPGSNLAMQVSHLTFARLLQGFDIWAPMRMPVDMQEGLGITLVKATPLEVVITPCLSSFMYQIYE